MITSLTPPPVNISMVSLHVCLLFERLYISKYNLYFYTMLNLKLNIALYYFIEPV